MNNLTVQCPDCASINHLIVQSNFALAYECLMCHNKNWFDSNAKGEYMNVYGVDGRGAETDLFDGIVTFALTDPNFVI
jgi:hypothetical protein